MSPSSLPDLTILDLPLTEQRALVLDRAFTALCAHQRKLCGEPLLGEEDLEEAPPELPKASPGVEVVMLGWCGSMDYTSGMSNGPSFENHVIWLQASFEAGQSKLLDVQAIVHPGIDPEHAPNEERSWNTRVLPAWKITEDERFRALEEVLLQRSITSTSGADISPRSRL